MARRGEARRSGFGWVRHGQAGFGKATAVRSAGRGKAVGVSRGVAR
jgi:hypothetical protein